MRLIRGKAKKDNGAIEEKREGGPQDTAQPSSFDTNPKAINAKPKIGAAGRIKLSDSLFLKFFDMDIEKLKLANRILIYAVCTALFIFAVDIVISQRQLERRKKDIVAHNKERRPKPEGAALTPEPYSYYSDVIGKRDLFKSDFASEAKRAQGQASGEATEDIISNLNLIGFVSGEKPQAIIEDKKAGKTYFLYEGDSFNGCSVLKIEDNKVVLEYGNRTVELMM